MNEPITIPRTHIILDAAVLTAISAGPTPGSPFEASFGIREAMLPGWIIKTRGWNNADVETAEAGFLTGYDYDDGGSGCWKRAVISYHLNI